MKHIICFHLLNDFSGSPKVLHTILYNLDAKKYEIELITSEGNGILNELKNSNIVIRKYNYSFSTNTLIAIFRYCIVQLKIFFIAFRYISKKNTIFYINTILPVGAALAGRIMGKEVVYHYHENAKDKGFLYRILAKIMLILASKIICVSQYQRSFLNRKKNVYIIPNAIPNKLKDELQPNTEKAFNAKCILMLSSLKKYKGVTDFIKLAQQLPQYKFYLVLNENQSNITKYFHNIELNGITNLTIFPRQENVSSFYNQSSIVLNLTNKKMAVETFGLTALEAMSAGLPVIVPTIGGIAEIVKNGINGYKIDVEDFDLIKKRIIAILENPNLYRQLSQNALSTAVEYSEQKMINKIEKILQEK